MAVPAVPFLMVLLFCFSLLFAADARSDAFDDSPPVWEPLLWGGPIDSPRPDTQRSARLPLEEFGGNDGAAGSGPRASIQGAQSYPSVGREVIRPPARDIAAVTRWDPPIYSSPAQASVVNPAATPIDGEHYLAPFRNLVLKNVAPLYVDPPLEGEGVWQVQGMPAGENGWPAIYKMSYRPSVQYPNAVVHMLLLDMKRLNMKLYIGSGEPGASPGSSMVEPEHRSRLVAITNALWKAKHSGEAGTIFRGQVLRPLAPGLATIVIYEDDSIDILEWHDGIPLSRIRDAKQLRHLILNDGKVVTTIEQGGRPADSEIGLGYLLSEEQPNPYQQYYWGFWGQPPPGQNMAYGGEWFIATRSAFGIRRDGNLVFAIGHHISTKDLAKALALAGCVRGIHADANPHNVVGNLYYVDEKGNLAGKAKLSPEQKTYTLDRYVDKSYTSDFFGFFLRSGAPESREASVTSRVRSD